MDKRIVVAGAGYAGVLAAKKIAKRVRKAKLADKVEITIIDKRPFHTMLTELHEVAAWRVEEESITVSLKRVFEGRGVNVVMDNISSVDYDNKTVIGAVGTYGYDYLVMTSGSQPIFFGIEGAKENSFTLWSYEDAVALREHIMKMFVLAACETDPDKKRSLLTFVVVGCGFTGVEMAGELSELAPFLCERFEIDPDLVTMINMDMQDRVCAILPEKLSNKIRRRLEKKNVQIILNANTTAIGDDFLDYELSDETRRIAAHTVIWSAGIEVSDIAKYASGILGVAPRGRIQTDNFLRSKNDPSVYVGGDNLFFVPEGEKNAVPQMVENCEASAEIIAHNLMCDLTGKGVHKAYTPKFHGSMICVGGRYGAAYVGFPGKFFALPSFLAMFTKHFINIVYFMQILGWNKVFSYIQHEFFTIRNCRSFLGGHFSNRSPSFMLVPLRIFLGFYWLYEGVVKVGAGWLQSPQLTGFIRGANDFYHSIIYSAYDSVTTGATQAADSVTAATSDAAAGGGDLIFSFSIFDQIWLILVNSGEYAFKMQVRFIDYILNYWVLPSESMQMAFQTAVVLAEILIGCALIAGLLTTPAALGALVLSLMFVSSTGLFMSTWWMPFAAVAMLFGGGRAFSLDYYFLPWLKKKWKKVRFVRKWYLYHD